MLIKNRSELLSQELSAQQLVLREIALEALEIAIEAVKPEKLVKKAVRIEGSYLYVSGDKYNLKDIGKIFIIGGGKATADMAFALEDILKEASSIDYEGVINIPEGLDLDPSRLSTKLKLNHASHPKPNEIGLKGTQEMVDLANKATKKDLIVCLISGGGSALMPLPKLGVSLEDLRGINTALLLSGANIQEFNCVRKHLSRFAGGNLARAISTSSGAVVVALIISDVVGDDLDVIASGPTVPDTKTFKDAVSVLKKYNLYESAPISIKKIMIEGLKNKALENPKPKDVCFKNVHNYLIGSVKSAVKEVSNFLEGKGFETRYFSDRMEGEAQDFGETLPSTIRKMIEQKSIKNEISKNALLATGELTVKVKGKGIGGRNQEMLLSFVNSFKGEGINNDFLILSVNLDGIEGNSEAMGAFVDNFILNRTISQKIDINEFLEENNSNEYFKRLKGEIVTGRTGCNVNDLLMIFVS